jgi:hypothetical protein
MVKPAIDLVFTSEIALQALLHTKHSRFDVATYDEFRRLISANDIAFALAVENLLMQDMSISKVASYIGTTGYLARDNAKAGDEYQRVFYPMSMSDSTKQSAMSFLNATLPVFSPACEKPYHFGVFGNVMVVGVSEGFLTYLNNNRRENIKQFYVDALELCRHSLQEHEVLSAPLYAQFIISCVSF